MKEEIPLYEAFDLVLENIKVKENFEYLPIENSLNKICFEDINALRNAPAFNNSAMDGYALISSDFGKKISIVGTIFAGDINEYSLSLSNCYKIMTGAKLPSNCDCVLPFENAIDSDDSFVIVPDDLCANANIRLKGEEFKVDKPLIKKGDILTPASLSLLASQGITYVKVYKELKIAIVSSGDELIEPWNRASELQLYNCNTMTLKMLLKGYNFDCDYKGVFPDNLEKSKEFIKNLKDYDVIISTGGVSMGEADFVSQAFVSNNMKPIFHKIKLKPGRPMLYGIMDKTQVFALPGNPMSTFVTAISCVISSLYKYSGANSIYFNTIIAQNKTFFKIARNKTAIIFGEYKNGIFEVIDDNRYTSGMLSPIVRANAIAIFCEEKNIVEENEDIKIILLYSNMINEKTNIINLD
jgi:molybdopterin molybdotransferase